MMKKVVGFAVIASLLAATGTSFAKDNSKSIEQEHFDRTPVNVTEHGTFDDENSASWAKQYIEYAAKKGYFHGDKGTKHFRPNGFLTREEFATVFENKFAVSAASTPINFADVPQTRYSYKAVEALTTHQYLDFFKTLTPNVFNFHPTDAVTRQDVAETLVKAYNLPLLDQQAATTLLQQQFKDASNVSKNLVPFVATAVKYKIMQGDGSKFRPTNSLSRAEAATLLYRLDSNLLVTGSSTDTVTGDNYGSTVTGDNYGSSSVTGSASGTVSGDSYGTSSSASSTGSASVSTDNATVPGSSN